MPPDPVALVRRSSGGSAVRLRARELDQLEHEVERRTRGQLLRIHAGEALMYRIRRRIRYRRRGGLSLRRVEQIELIAARHRQNATSNIMAATK